SVGVFLWHRYRSSSVPEGQSGTPSHTLSVGTHWSPGHCNSPAAHTQPRSSLRSPQSSCPSHRWMYAKQRPPTQRNSPAPHVAPQSVATPPKASVTLYPGAQAPGAAPHSPRSRCTAMPPTVKVTDLVQVTPVLPHGMFSAVMLKWPPTSRASTYSQSPRKVKVRPSNVT
uniref:Uncharacterized protein n=1 Tax=Paramormyrops kingsleyae TaxID=1676925 RepID=A0A3B3SAG0_9TELE